MSFASHADQFGRTCEQTSGWVAGGSKLAARLHDCVPVAVGDCRLFETMIIVLLGVDVDVVHYMRDQEE